ncbi:MAG TPA: DUF2066 domain-containing protein [Steroidobacteraceae bacterium]|nr:DUF2066 domain-containing protein [Steroidobacteraceae bacterium]
MGLRERLALGLLGLVLSTAAAAAAVDSLYEAIVPGDGTEAGRAAAATEALKQVVVRVTGRGAAATEPALATVYAAAPRFAQTYRAVAAGQVAVGFDAAALDAALLAAGQRLWSRERPLTLVLLVSERPGAAASLAGAADPDLRRAVERAAQLRGLPVAWVGGLDAGTQQARIGDALAGRLEALRGLAREFGADGVLVGRSGTSGITWSWLGPAGSGTLVGSATEAIETVADRYGAQLGTQGGSTGRLAVVIRGVRDLAGYAAATQVLGSLDNVSDVALEEAAGETLRFQLSFTGDPEALRQAATQAARLAPDEDAPADGALHFVLRP